MDKNLADFLAFMRRKTGNSEWGSEIKKLADDLGLDTVRIHRVDPCPAL